MKLYVIVKNGGDGEYSSEYFKDIDLLNFVKSDSYSDCEAYYDSGTPDELEVSEYPLFVFEESDLDSDDLEIFNSRKGSW